MPQRLALTIGINKHQERYINLNYARKDAEEVAKMLRDPQRGGFNHVRELLDEEATKAKILEAVEILLEGLDPGDLALIYFSGHGAIDKGDDLILVPYDIRFGSGHTLLATSAVHMKEIEIILENTAADSVVIILDACHGGGGGKLLGRIDYNENSNIILVGASRFSELAWETAEFEHGRFTQLFLSSANLPPSIGEWISLHHALSFIQTELEKNNPKQTVEVSSHTVNQNILLFKNPLIALDAPEFVDEVKHLCQISNFGIITLQSEQLSQNMFIMREQRGWGRYDDTLVLCLDNSHIKIQESHITQFNLVFSPLQRKGEITSGMFISRNELPIEIKQLLHPSISARTIDDIQRSLINFDQYLQQIIREFEVESPNQIGMPPLKATYIELNAKIPYPDNNRRHITEPISTTISKWLQSDSTSAIVLGGYGTGKSTYSQKLAFDLAKSFLGSKEKQSVRIPLLIPLRKFPKYTGVDIEAFIISYLKKQCNVFNPDYQAFKAMNDAGLFVLIFDGFDEMAVHADRNVIQRNYDAIIRFAVGKDTKVLLTSRPEAFLSREEEFNILKSMKNELSSEDYPTIKRIDLKPFTEDQVQDYFRKRIPYIGYAQKNNRSWRYYYEQIENVIGLQNLCKRPVLLEMTIKTLPKLLHNKLKVTRPRLYEIYLRGEIERQVRYKERDFLIRGEDKRLSLIQNLARYLYTEKRNEITQIQIRDFFKEEFEKIPNFDPEALLRDLIGCSFLSREEDNFRFSHRSFMEYLVAKELAEELNQGHPTIFRPLLIPADVRSFLAELKPQDDDTWRETLWNWIKSTINLPKDSIDYLGGNAISLLNDLKESFVGLDLSNTLLVGADLKFANLNEAQCNNCNLGQSDFVHASLKQANFKGATLNQSTFKDAYLDEADFREADLTHSSFENASCFKTNFEKAKLVLASLTAAKLTDANFQYADLTRVSFFSGTFKYITFSGTPLKEHIEKSPMFQNAVIEGMKFHRPSYLVCFPSGTRIRLASGEEKNIECLKIGDVVLSYHEKDTKLVSSVVEHLFIRESLSLVVINEGKLVTTPSETLFNGNDWVLAKDLVKGDTLITSNNKTILVESIQEIFESTRVYHFKALPYHNFFANDTLVHNSTKPRDI